MYPANGCANAGGVALAPAAAAARAAAAICSPNSRRRRIPSDHAGRNPEWILFDAHVTSATDWTYDRPSVAPSTCRLPGRIACRHGCPTLDDEWREMTRPGAALPSRGHRRDLSLVLVSHNDVRR